MTKEEQKQYEYHKAREDTHFLKKIKEDEKLNKEIGKAYQRAYDNIQAEIDGWIGKYAAFENISVEEARKRVSELDVKAFERKAKRYVEERDFSKRANEELRLYNLAMRVNRQELLKRNIGLELIGLADQEDKILRKALIARGADELTRQAGILGMGAAQKERMARGIGKVVDGDFHSATFSNRIWTNQSALRRKLEEGIDRTILRGENPTVWARKLRHEVGESFKHAKLASERIAVTESARVQVQIATKSFEDMGYEKMVVICEPGACKVCKPHDQDVVSLEEAHMGHNIPLWHPYCRCSVAAWMSPIEVGRAKAQYNLADGGDVHSLEKSLGNDFVDRIAEANGTKGIKMTMHADEEKSGTLYNMPKSFGLDELINDFEKYIDDDEYKLKDEYFIGKFAINKELGDFSNEEVYVEKISLERILQKHGKEFSVEEMKLIKKCIENPMVVADNEDRHNNSLLLYSEIPNRDRSVMECVVVKNKQNTVIHYHKIKIKKIRKLTQANKIIYKRE